MYAMVNRLLWDDAESIEIINNGAYCPALTVRKLPYRDKNVRADILPEGLYAIFTHKGETAAIEGLYAAVLNYWLPKSKYKSGEAHPYVIYLNNASMTAPENLLTELYIPLVEK